MNINKFDYKLPKKLIAQRPVSPRDHSRLLVINRQNNRISHDKFFNVVNYLNRGDILVLNNSKVFPARLIGFKEVTKGKVEILLNNQIETGLWQCVGRNLKINLRIKFNNSKLTAIVLKKAEDLYDVKFNMSEENFISEINKIGIMPLPPYIKRTKESTDKSPNDSEISGSRLKIWETKERDKRDYQTVYAKEIGSVAAPTAGLHFTKKLIQKIRKKDVQIEYLTLHVGLGTFAPVSSNEIENHKIHKEYYSINLKTLHNIIKAKSENRRVIAAGTTTTRVLEHFYNKLSINKSRLPTNKDIKINSEFLNLKKMRSNNPKEDLSGWTDIFIYPGYKFKCVDSIITNFHLPKSTLLMLVSAFAGKDLIDKIYQEAIINKYRFYSFGDAMLIV